MFVMNKDQLRNQSWKLIVVISLSILIHTKTMFVKV